MKTPLPRSMAHPIPTPLLPLDPDLYPSRVDAGTVHEWVSSWHARPEDFEEGDLTDRLYTYGVYELKEVGVATIDGLEWGFNEDVVLEYAHRTTPLPPIVLMADREEIIDGTHRFQAALLRQQATVWAYVGVSGT